jgi:hypothetical protein
MEPDQVIETRRDLGNLNFYHFGVVRYSSADNSLWGTP